MRLVPLKTRENGAAPIIVMHGETEAVAASESVTITVKQNTPVVEGVPVIHPVEAPSERPGGKEPAVIAKV